MYSRVYALIMMLAAVGAAVVALGWPGIVLAVILIASAEYLGRAKSLRDAREKIVVVILCWIVLGYFLIPNIEESRECSRRNSCENHLREIALALQNYHHLHGHFPPAYLADADGRPMHSWRVLLLPYLDRKDLHEQYDFNEPWDGPNNSKLADQRPSFYACPSDDAAGRNRQTTSYLAVTGNDAAWPGRKSSRLDDFAEEGRNTIMLIECADSKVNWLEPRDISIEEIKTGFNQDRERGIKCLHNSDSVWILPPKKAVLAAFADGRVHFLPADIPPPMLTKMLTRQADESEYLDRRPPSHAGALEWTAFAAMWLFCFLLMIRRLGQRRSAVVK
jgi:hypothetical protein